MRYAGLGVQLAVSLLVFVLAGQWADKKLGTGGILNPVVSVAEDIVATAASLVAIYLPGLVLLILAIFAISSILLVRRFRRSRADST